MQHLELHGTLVNRDNEGVLLYNHAREGCGGSFADARALAAHGSTAHGLISDPAAEEGPLAPASQ